LIKIKVRKPKAKLKKEYRGYQRFLAHNYYSLGLIYIISFLPISNLQFFLGMGKKPLGAQNFNLEELRA